MKQSREELLAGWPAAAAWLALVLALASVALTACVTPQLAKYAIAPLSAQRVAAIGRRLAVVPSSLKILADESPGAPFAASVALHAARGEAESAQILLYSGAAAIGRASYSAVELVGPEGYRITPEIGIVGYIPVTKPTLVGFHRRGAYPDPILCADAPFSVAAGRNQALWYTVWVPRDAPPGRYTGRLTVAIDPAGTTVAAVAFDPGIIADPAAAAVLELPVELTVYPVDLPVTSFLKTSINFRQESNADSRYYGAAWTPELAAGLPALGLKYRFSPRVDLPWNGVFGEADGVLSADWTEFDAATEAWLSLGITCFEIKLPINGNLLPQEIEDRYGGRLKAINDHLSSRGWAGLFYFYFYDEPNSWEMAVMADRLRAIRRHAPDIANILTYGITKAGQTRLDGLVGIWVPNLHQYDPAFAAERRRRGEAVWVYTCNANIFFRYPDNYRIDSYGAAHRALGWWLFRYDVSGFLYWAVDLWRRDPWANAATFPWTNGDGMLFYPAPDKRSLPYPSVRVHLMRDGFEDYDLLTLLRAKGVAAGRLPAAAQAILDMADLIPAIKRFSADDELYIDYHRRLLEQLAADWAAAAP